MFGFSLNHYCTAIAIVVVVAAAAAAAAASLVVNVAIGRQSNVIDRPLVSSVYHIARHAASDTLSHTDRPILSYHRLASADVCRSHAYVHRPFYIGYPSLRLVVTTDSDSPLVVPYSLGNVPVHIRDLKRMKLLLICPRDDTSSH